MTDLLVNELFGPTFQGEGPSLGNLCGFLRLAFCNQKCVFCDSVHSWGYKEELIKGHNYVSSPYDRNKEVKDMPIDQIVDYFREMNPPMLVITGGEPMLQSSKLPELIAALINEVPFLARIEIETAGTIWDKELKGFPFVYFNVSPKLENSGNPKELRYKPDVLRNFDRTERAIFKFVVKDDQDLDEVQEIVDEVQIHESKIYIMPEGITGDAINGRLQELAEKVIARRWNLTTRLHVLLWGTKRGV